MDIQTQKEASQTRKFNIQTSFYTINKNKKTYLQALRACAYFTSGCGSELLSESFGLRNFKEKYQDGNEQPNLRRELAQNIPAINFFLEE